MLRIVGQDLRPARDLGKHKSARKHGGRARDEGTHHLGQHNGHRKITSIEEQSKIERAKIDKEKTLQMGDKEIEKAACQEDAEIRVPGCKSDFC